jgi:hypothetical protein
VGVLTAGGWCTSNGVAVDCTQAPPARAGQSCPQGSVTGLDAAGAVTCRPRVGFLARRASPVSLPFGTITTVAFDEELYDDGNAFDAASGVFTAPVSGVYAFSGAIMVQDVAVGELYYMHLHAGGRNHGASGSYATNTSWNTANASAIVYLNAGQTAHLIAYAASTSGTLYGNAATNYLWTYLQGALLE